MKRFLPKRFLPSGLTGRIILILTLGLFSAQAIAIWLFLHDRETPIKMLGLSFADRVVTIVDMLDALPPNERAKLLRALNSSYLQVGALDAPPPAPKWEAQGGFFY